MWQRAYGFLVVLLLMFSKPVLGQQQMPRCGQNSPHISRLSPVFKVKDLGFRQENKVALNVIHPFIYKPDTADLTKYNPDHLGYFCRKELQFEKITSVPFRFRLGSLEYENKMEGKK